MLATGGEPQIRPLGLKSSVGMTVEQLSRRAQRKVLGTEQAMCPDTDGSMLSIHDPLTTIHCLQCTVFVFLDM
jgi:hypothetical protein